MCCGSHGEDLWQGRSEEGLQGAAGTVYADFVEVFRPFPLGIHECVARVPYRLGRFRPQFLAQCPGCCWRMCERFEPG